MVAAPDLGSGVERRGGSSPFMRTAKAVCDRNGYRQLLHYGALGMSLGHSNFCSSTVGIYGDIDAGVVRSFGAEWHTL